MNSTSTMSITPRIDPTNVDHSTLLKAMSLDITNPLRRLYFRTKGSNRLKTLGLNQTIYEFTRSLWQALQIHDSALVFEPAYPSYVLDKEDAAVLREGRSATEIPEKIITWNVIRRQPGSLDSQPFARTKEMLPRVREELFYDPAISADPLEPEQYPAPEIGSDHEHARIAGREIQGQFFDNLIQFDIWAKNNRTAEEMTEYFEDFMLTFRKMFLELGIAKLNFHSRVRDEVILNWRNGLINRSLIYYVRTEKVTATPVRVIKRITVNAEFHKLITEVEENGTDNFLKDYENTIIRNWIERDRSTRVEEE